MSWKCPECDSDNSDSMMRCYCGHEFGQDNSTSKMPAIRDWQKIEKTKKLLRVIAICGLILFLRELDRIEKAAILDRQEEERRATDKYRQYK